MNIIKSAHAIKLGRIEGIGENQDFGGRFSAATRLEALISTLVGALTAIAGIAFLIYFLLGALNWITAGGDPTKVEKAQKTMTSAIIGLIAVIVAYFIVSIVGTILDIDILNPSKLIGLDP